MYFRGYGRVLWSLCEGSLGCTELVYSTDAVRGRFGKLLFEKISNLASLSSLFSGIAKLVRQMKAQLSDRSYVHVKLNNLNKRDRQLFDRSSYNCASEQNKFLLVISGNLYHACVDRQQ